MEISALLSVGMNIGDSTYEWNTLLSRDTSSQVERSAGQGGDEFEALYLQTIQWTERTFASTQLAGSHFLNSDGSIFGEWQVTASSAYRYAPDRRDFVMASSRDAVNATDIDAFRSSFDFGATNDDQDVELRNFFIEPGSGVHSHRHAGVTLGFTRRDFQHAVSVVGGDGLSVQALVERGQVLAAPGTITPHTEFKCEAYVLTKEEGGRHTPFFSNYRPQFYFRTTDVTGSAELPSGTEMVMPGDNIAMTVTLIAPIAMDEGLRFAIREGGRTVGAGVVASIVK